MVDAYLERIGWRGPIRPSAEALLALHRAHLLTVPFENLDIHLGRPVQLDEGYFFSKIVEHRRGGFCYELNGLFRLLLEGLGFRVTMLNSLLPEEMNGCGLAYDHPILLVELEERWIVDVGFGDAFRTPLRLDARGHQSGLGLTYRLSGDGARWFLERRIETGDWRLDYAFTLRPASLPDFQEACRYYETSPLSTFTQSRLCSRATPGGSISLSDRRLTFTDNGLRREVPVPDEEEFTQALRTHFGIELDAPFLRAT